MFLHLEHPVGLFLSHAAGFFFIFFITFVIASCAFFFFATFFVCALLIVDPPPTAQTHTPTRRGAVVTATLPTTPIYTTQNRKHIVSIALLPVFLVCGLTLAAGFFFFAAAWTGKAMLCETADALVHHTQLGACGVRRRLEKTSPHK